MHQQILDKVSSQHPQALVCREGYSPVESGPSQRLLHLGAAATHNWNSADVPTPLHHRHPVGRYHNLEGNFLENARCTMFSGSHSQMKRKKRTTSEKKQWVKWNVFLLVLPALCSSQEIVRHVSEITTGEWALLNSSRLPGQRHADSVAMFVWSRPIQRKNELSWV